ncbi:MAG: TraR/DksA family transcriptional regulator [Methylococcales bacterium]|nr:TraR/DksA family transcriptional regulator [Methylococcales bacterium]
MNEYTQVRSQLMAMLEELNQRLDRITNNVRHVDHALEKDFAEQATQNENDEVMDYLGNSARFEIEQIKLAIARIDQDGYGVCQQCGEPIGKQRLIALPYVDRCIQCASIAEQKS